MKRAFVVPLCFLAMFSYSSELKAELTVNLTNGEWPPYLSEHLPENGFASHIVKKAFAKVGVKVSFGFYPWSRSYAYAEAGEDIHGRKWHGTLVWSKTEARENRFYYSDPVVMDDEVLFYLKDNRVEWEKIEDLKGLIIAGTQHTAYPVLEEAASKGLITLERAGNYDVLLKRLYYRRIDATPLIKYVGLYYLDTSFAQDDAAKIGYSDKVIEPRKYHLILNRNDPVNKKLMEKFNQGLAVLKASGEYDQMYRTLQQGGYNR